MGGRSSSFNKKSVRGGSSAPNLKGTAEQIKQAEEIRKPYIDAFENVKVNNYVLAHKAIRALRGETDYDASQKDLNFPRDYYHYNDSVERDVRNIRDKYGASDWQVSDLADDVRAGRIPLKRAQQIVQNGRKAAKKEVANFYSQGRKILTKDDATWWIHRKKDLR